MRRYENGTVLLVPGWSLTIKSGGIFLGAPPKNPKPKPKTDNQSHSSTEVCAIFIECHHIDLLWDGSLFF